jgi:hypothetical protein
MLKVKKRERERKLDGPRAITNILYSRLVRQPQIDRMKRGGGRKKGRRKEEKKERREEMKKVAPTFILDI